jgi:hypothetical protein
VNPMSSFKEGIEDWNLYVADRDRAEIHRHKLFADHLRHLPEIIREGLNNPNQRLYALEIAEQLPIELRKGLLPILLAIAGHVSAHILRARELILAFPHEWLLKNVEGAAVPLLESGDEEEYRRILELYLRVDGSLALGLAKRAASHLDAEVRAVGKEFLDQLKSVDT